MHDIGRIGFSEEQGDLLDAATVFCREKSPIATVRRLIEDETGHDVEVWRGIGDLGWRGAAIPEGYGGLGLPIGALVPMVEQMGRRLLAGPFLSTTLAAQAVMAGGTEAQKQEILPRIAGGGAATLALMEPSGDWTLEDVHSTATDTGRDGLRLTGGKVLVCDAADADWIVVSVIYEGRANLVVVEKASIAPSLLRREVIVDETKRAFALTLDGIETPKRNLLDPARAEAALGHIHLLANLLAAEACGGTQAVIDYTIEYLKTRTQFGKLIGAYQALKHPIVDAYVAYEQARSHLYSAAHCFDEPGVGEIAVRMAKVQADGAFAADRAIQFHGGFGFTYDCDAQLYRRRAIWHAAQYGDQAYHKRRLADLLFRMPEQSQVYA